MTLLVEATLFHPEDVSLAAATEPVLLNLEEAFAVGLRVLGLVDEEMAVNVDRVLHLLFAREVTGLGDLADDDCDAEVFFTPVGYELDDADLRHGVGGAVGVLAVVQRLEGVEDEEDLLRLVLLAKRIGMLQDAGDEGVLAGDEAVLHADALGDLANLEEGFFPGVEEADVAGLGDGVGELEAHGGFACTGGAGEEHRRGGRHAIAAESIVEERDTGLDGLLQFLGNIQVEDVGAALPGLQTDIELHLRHVLTPLVGIRRPLYHGQR